MPDQPPPATNPGDQHTQDADNWRTCSLLASPTLDQSLDLPSIPGYEILGVLGRGGMAIVYKARQIGLNRLVALKMLLGGKFANPVELARFRQEGETTARLQHPNIVRIHEVGEYQGHPFLALEFVPGGSLARKTAGVPQPPQDAARLVETLAWAVHHAHEHGIIHRDLTPANILLNETGIPQISDFGLARELGDGTQLTASGAILGTPGFMAPEQAGANHPIGRHTDVYALGAILYDQLTGHPPFQAGSLMSVLHLTMYQEPDPIHRLRRDVPRDLEIIALKCLQKEPAKRYTSAAALADDLHRFLADEPITARPVGIFERAWRWCRRHPGWAAILAVVLLLLGMLIGGGTWLNVELWRALTDAKVKLIRNAGGDDTRKNV